MNNTQKILLMLGIISFIVILEIFINTSTDKLLDETSKKLEQLKVELKEENYEESKRKSEELNKIWFEYENKLSFFIQHDEVEKVTTKIAVISENADNGKFKSALEDLMETTYLLDHVKDKNKLKWKNIF